MRATFLQCLFFEAKFYIRIQIWCYSRPQSMRILKVHLTIQILEYMNLTKLMDLMDLLIISKQKIFFQFQSIKYFTYMGNNQTSITKRGNILEFQSEPFDEGSIRYAFRAKITKGPGKGEKGVIKVFKHAPMRNCFISAQKEMKVYGIANDYAKMFCNKLLQIGFKYSIHFPEPDLVKIKSLSFFTWLKSDYFTSQDYVVVEQYLKGDYIKFTNNAGYSRSDQVMDAFQHYSYVKSGKYAICCDLQGVLVGNKYFLTDPAVNSIDNRFGNTDIGKIGIQLVMKRHKCMNLCKKIGLEDNGSYDPSLKPVFNSTTQRHSHTYGI